MHPTNMLDGTWLESLALTVGTESANKINVVVSAVQPRGLPPAKPTKITGYLSDNSDGSTVTATAPTTLAIQTGGRGTLTEHVANTVFTVELSTGCAADIELGDAGASTWYLVLVDMDGTLVVSDAITFA